jgi:diguanylate cyclase (GGDEF)-like protein
LTVRLPGRLAVRWPALRAPRRLSTRIVGLSLGLLLLVQAAGFTAIHASIDRNARQALAAELEVGERIWQRLLQQKGDGLVQGARVLAADFGFRSALGEGGDPETLASALENVGERIGAGVTAWVDAGMQVRALHDSHGALGDKSEIARIAGDLARLKGDRQISVLQGRPVQFVAVPVRAPLLLGWVVMGFPIDQALVDDMRALSGLQVALLTAADGAAPRLVATTLRGVPAAALASPGPGPGDGSGDGIGNGHGHGSQASGNDSTRLGGETWQTRRVALGDGGSPAAAGAQLVLLRSVDEAVARYTQLRVVLAAITLIGVAVFAFGSMVTARRVTTPLRALVRASVRLGRGDYGSAVQHTERADEVGDLAKAFDHMRVNLASHEHEIRQLAYWDRLTGLPNRAQFRDALGAAIEASRQAADDGIGPPREPVSVAVVMLDLDRFKHVNDVLGYAFGDRLLKAVAERLATLVLRQGDLVARFSGDEFALLLPGNDAAAALAVAERIASAFETPLTLDDQTVDLAAGFGVACWPAHAADVDALMSHAEIAMYSAKHKTVTALVYDPGLDAGSAQTLSLLSELRQALERNELRLFLQPKIALASGRMRGAEALVRWQHPQRGLVPPMQFIPFAEQTGFVRLLTLWIFEETARHWPVLRALGLERVSVNLSTRDLMDQDLLAKLMALLQRHGASPRVFCLEITESAIMDEPQRALAMLNSLSEAGFKLSIDDFGTGYSSLAYLKKLPVDELKIDKSFVMAMAADAEDAKIVRSTIDLAHNLGLTVVAEGVETAAILDQLRELDCDEAQGYFMSKPLPASELPAFAARWARELDPQVH